MTIKDATETMIAIQKALVETYPEALKETIDAPYGAKVRCPKLGWEIRLRSGIKDLDRAIGKIRSSISEAEPYILKESA